MVLTEPGDLNPFTLGRVMATTPMVVVQCLAYTRRGPQLVWFKDHREVHQPTCPQGYLPWVLEPLGPDLWTYVQRATARRAKEALAEWFQLSTGLRTLS